MWIRAAALRTPLTLFDTMHLACFSSHSGDPSNDPGSRSGIPTGSFFPCIVFLGSIEVALDFFIYFMPQLIGQKGLKAELSQSHRSLYQRLPVGADSLIHTTTVLGTTFPASPVSVSIITRAAGLHPAVMPERVTVLGSL